MAEELLERVLRELRERKQVAQAAYDESRRLEQALAALGPVSTGATRVGDGSSPRRRSRPRRTRAAPGVNRERILALVREHPGMTAAELARATGIARSTVSAALGRLVDAGEVQHAELPGRAAGLPPARRRAHAGSFTGAGGCGLDCGVAANSDRFRLSATVPGRAQRAGRASPVVDRASDGRRCTRRAASCPARPTAARCNATCAAAGIATSPPPTCRGAISDRRASTASSSACDLAIRSRRRRAPRPRPSDCAAGSRPMRRCGLRWRKARRSRAAESCSGSPSRRCAIVPRRSSGNGSWLRRAQGSERRALRRFARAASSGPGRSATTGLEDFYRRRYRDDHARLDGSPPRSAAPRARYAATSGDCSSA